MMEPRCRPVGLGLRHESYGLMIYLLFVGVFSEHRYPGQPWFMDDCR